MGCRLLGEANPSWNGGRRLIDGYVFVNVGHEHPMANSNGYCAEHRLVMAEHIGRMLEPEEVVHHEDGDTTSNDIANLLLFASQAEHVRHHHATAGLGSHRDPVTGRYARRDR